MAAPSKNFTVISDARMDADSPWTENETTDLRDNDIYLEEWLGKDYTADVNHKHDGTGSSKIAGFSDTGTPGNQAVPASSQYTMPAGDYNIGAPAATITFVQIQLNSAWRTAIRGQSDDLVYAATVWSDGTNTRLSNEGVSSQTFYWIKRD